MTNEKRYELVVRMLRAYDTATDNSAAEQIIKNPREWEKCVLPFYGEAAQLLLDAQMGLDKAATPASRVAALNRVYKCCSDARPNMQGAFKSGDRWAICDGYRFVRVNSKPESVPECIGGFDIDKTIPPDAREHDVVELPSAAEVKKGIAEMKAKYGRGWTRQAYEALPGWWCNPKYLLDMVQIFPDAKAYRPRNELSALYCECEDGDALLLPVRHSA